MQRFSVVVAMRDTPREREFAKKAIPSAIALNPSELVVGIDDDPDAADLTEYIRSQTGGFTNLRIVRVPRSSEWRFPLANVIWHCYKACSNNHMLVFDIDTILRPTVMKGLSLVGRENVAVVSFTKRILCRTVGDHIRYITYRLRVRRSSYVFAGIYWVWRPYYFDAVDRDGMSKIANGIDSYMVHAINRDGRYSILTLKDIGVTCMDYENEYYPWRQFSDGVYLGANSPRNPIARARFTVHVLHSTIALNERWKWRGFRWAARHPDSPACQAARRVDDVNEWAMYGGSRFFKNMDWERRGTGYI